MAHTSANAMAKKSLRDNREGLCVKVATRLDALVVVGSIGLDRCLNGIRLIGDINGRVGARTRAGGRSPAECTAAE